MFAEAQLQTLRARFEAQRVSNAEAMRAVHAARVARRQAVSARRDARGRFMRVTATA